MVNWKRKLASRKFWALVGAVTISVCALIGAGDEVTVKVTALITAVGATVTYILAEGAVDARNLGDGE